MMITVIGSASLDLAARSAIMPQPGVTIRASDYRSGPGGKGCNQAIALARLGHVPGFLAKIGDDAMGAILLTALESEGIDIAAILRTGDAPTGIAMTHIDHNGENMITAVSGANAQLTETDIETHQSLISEADFLLVQLESPASAIACAMKHARSTQTTTILDPAPVADRVVMRDLVSLCHIVTPNQGECSALTGITPTDMDSARRAASVLHRMGANTVILKMGRIGAFFCDGSQSDLVPGYQVSSVDSVAAGDCFNAGLASALHEGASLREAVKFACAAGALTTTQSGAASATPYRHEVAEFMESARQTCQHA